MTTAIRLFFNKTDMKKLIIILALALAPFAVRAAEYTDSVPDKQNETMAEEFKIIKDEIVDGVRYISATPCQKVCSKRIDISIKDGIIESVVYTGGCNGNAKGIGALIKGMSIEEAIKRLDGITCGNRGTSCPDQLAKVLKAISL